jgi:hypothetical protein
MAILKNLEIFWTICKCEESLSMLEVSFSMRALSSSHSLTLSLSLSLSLSPLWPVSPFKVFVFVFVFVFDLKLAGGLFDNVVVVAFDRGVVFTKRNQPCLLRG